MQVFVSDDGSTCDWRALTLSFATRLRLRLLSQSRRGFRLATVRNRAIRAATSDVIICLDCDTIPVRDFVRAHMRWFHAPGALATIGPRKFIRADDVLPEDLADGADWLRHRASVRSISNAGKRLDKRRMDFRKFKLHPHPYNCFYGGNVAFPRMAALELGLFDEDFNGHWGYEDIEFGYRLYRAGHRLVYEPHALGLHQENEIVSVRQRVVDAPTNRQKLYARVPSLGEYRALSGGS